MAQDAPLEVLQRRCRLDAERVDQRAAQLAVGVERLALPSRAVQREHPLAVEVLAQRVLDHQPVQLADQLGRAAERQVGVDPRLDRGQPQLLQPGDGGRRERLEREVGQGLAPPQRRGPRAAAAAARSAPSARSAAPPPP